MLIVLTKFAVEKNKLLTGIRSVDEKEMAALVNVRASHVRPRQ